MRILRIAGENLASFEGKFALDFEQDPLNQAPLFAITGPTGSGKSTILDALCLALFDQIPRYRNQHKISSDMNETSSHDTRQLLRKGCGSANASAVFVGNDGQKYRSTWSVKRAYSKADGNLQNVIIQLEKLPSLENQGGKKLETLRKIEELIGYSFEQFRRSVLLAQNEFADFIRAKAKDRALLLEALTGTEIFAKISQNVYEHTQNLKSSHRDILNQLNQVRPLPLDERLELEAAFSQKTQKRNDLESNHKAMEDAQRLYENREKADRLVKEAQEQVIQVETEIEIFKPTASKLKALERLADAEVLYKQIQDFQNDINHEEKTIETIRSESKTLSETLANKRKILLAAEAELRQLIKEWEEAKPTRQEAQRLEMAYQSSAETIELLVAKFEEKSMEMEVISKELNPIKAQRLQQQKVWQEGQDKLKTNKHMGYWYEHRSAIQQDHDSWQNVTKKKETLRKELESQKQTLEQFKVQQEKAEKKLQAARNKLETAESNQKELDSIEGKIHQNIQETNELLDQKTALVDQIANFERSKERLHSYITAKEDLAKTEAEITGLLHSTTQLQQDIQLAKAKLEEIEWAWEQAKNVASLAEKRADLVQNEPCPLCGSIEHPWADNTPPIDQTLQMRKDEQQKAYFKLNQQISREKEKLDQKQEQAVTLKHKIEVLKDEMNPLPEMVEIQDQLNKLLTMRKELNETIQTKKNEQVSLQSHISHLKSVIFNAEKAQSELKNAGQDLEKIKGKNQEMSWQVNQKIAQSKDHIQQQEIAFQKLNTWFQPGSFEPNWLEKAERHNQLQMEMESLQQRLQILNQDIQHLDFQLSTKTKETQSLQDQLEKEHTRQKHLREKITALIGNNTLESLETNFNTAKDQLVSQIEKQQMETRSLQDHCLQLQTKFNLSQQRLESLHKSLVENQSNFAKLCSQKEIEPIQAIKLFQWPLEDRKEAARHSQKLDKQLLEAKALIKERNSKLEEVNNQTTPPWSPTELEEVLAQTKIQIEQARKEASESEYLLRRDDERISETKKLQQQFESETNQLNLAEKLNELVGSASGDKFRLFAQNLALEQLLAEANLHLTTLAPRYQLARVEDADLECEIIDRDMGDERRFLVSLSGGETFLISLALALGLSDISSGGQRCPNLFIDEGFGALDPQSLDQAISALENLQATGRQVGIITHVENLAERVAAHIRVQPTRRGSQLIIQ